MNGLSQSTEKIKKKTFDLPLRYVNTSRILFLKTTKTSIYKTAHFSSWGPDNERPDRRSPEIAFFQTKLINSKKNNLSIFNITSPNVHHQYHFFFSTKTKKLFYTIDGPSSLSMRNHNNHERKKKRKLKLWFQNI